MTAVPAFFWGELESDSADLFVHRLAAENLVETSAGTAHFEQDDSETQLPAIPSTSMLTYFSDGSVVRAPGPMTVRAWKAMPTSAGKTFEWEGVVVAIKGEAFQARMLNVKGAGTSFAEIAEFDIASVPIGDRDLIKPGGILRWVVGLESVRGTRMKYSKIVFRRLPAWTRGSLEKATDKLKETVSAIKWSVDEQTGSR